MFPGAVSYGSILTLRRATVTGRFVPSRGSLCIQWTIGRFGRGFDQPSALAECRKIDSGWRIPPRRAVAGAKLHRDVLVAIRNPQWRPGDGLWMGGNRRSGIGP